jgi:hypothetical protein
MKGDAAMKPFSDEAALSAPGPVARRVELLRL